MPAAVLDPRPERAAPRTLLIDFESSDIDRDALVDDLWSRAWVEKVRKVGNRRMTGLRLVYSDRYRESQVRLWLQKILDRYEDIGAAAAIPADIDDAFPAPAEASASPNYPGNPTEAGLSEAVGGAREDGAESVPDPVSLVDKEQPREVDSRVGHRMWSGKIRRDILDFFLSVPITHEVWAEVEAMMNRDVRISNLFLDYPRGRHTVRLVGNTPQLMSGLRDLFIEVMARHGYVYMGTAKGRGEFGRIDGPTRTAKVLLTTLLVLDREHRLSVTVRTPDGVEVTAEPPSRY